MEFEENGSGVESINLLFKLRFILKPVSVQELLVCYLYRAHGNIETLWGSVCPYRNAMIAAF